MNCEEYNTCTSNRNAKNSWERGNGSLLIDSPKGNCIFRCGQQPPIIRGFVLGQAKYKHKYIPCKSSY